MGLAKALTAIIVCPSVKSYYRERLKSSKTQSMIPSEELCNSYVFMYGFLIRDMQQQDGDDEFVKRLDMPVLIFVGRCTHFRSFPSRQE